MRIVATLFLSMIIMTLAGCSTTHQARIPGVVYPDELALEPLTRDQYVVLGTVEGRGVASYTGLWPIPIFWFDDEGKGAKTSSGWKIGFGGNIEKNRAKAAAVYNALQKVPEADLLLEPRFQLTVHTRGIWYSRVEAIVIGKAVRIKTDEELAGQG